HSGIARINLSLRHPGSLKPLHILPAFFLAGSLACLAAAAISLWALAPLGFVSLLWLTDAALRNRSLWVGLLAVATSFVQLSGYGAGLIAGAWRRLVLHRSERQANATSFF
ncbi:MAG: glycosyl transferase family 2, partial [Rikenellaceae bacterium]|nr:glycosyl transferase family 2 [Rikenellaceae bacterium]